VEVLQRTASRWMRRCAHEHQLLLYTRALSEFFRESHERFALALRTSHKAVAIPDTRSRTNTAAAITGT